MGRQLLAFDTFRARLTLLMGGLSLLTMLSVGLFVGHVATQQATDAAGEQILSTASATAQLLATKLRERELEIALLSRSPYLTQGELRDVAHLEALQQRQQLRGEFAWLAIIDAEGQVLHAIDGMLQGQSVAERPWFVAARQGVFVGELHEALMLSKLLPEQATGEPHRFIDFAAPIHDQHGRLRGVVGAHARWSWVTQTVEEKLARRGLGQGVELLIVNKAGTVLYPRALAGRLQLPAGLLPGRAAALARWSDGMAYLASEVEVKTGTRNALGWRVVVRQNADQALAPADRLRKQLLTLGLLAGLLFSAASLYLARSISRPIEQLVAATRRIERRSGEPAYPSPQGPREIRQLGHSIRSMTTALLSHERELEAVNASLEQQVRQRTAALEAANLELARLATQDGLTGVNNRRRFDERLMECFQAACRSRRGYALLLLDVDHFKSVNDRFGHLVGDLVLRQLAQLLTQGVRSVDFVARFGGEEFAILLPETASCEAAGVLAEKIRQTVETATFPVAGQLKVSIGLSGWRPQDASPSDVVERADQAMYRAKQDGRNRVRADDAA